MKNAFRQIKLRFLKPVTMKKIFYFLLFICASCNNDDDAKPQQHGPLETYLKDNNVSIIKTTKSSIVYSAGNATHRGYIFTPLKDIKLTHVGAKIAETGTFDVELIEMDGMYIKYDTLVSEDLTINNTENFIYKEIKTPLVLKANKSYLLRYFNESHSSVYDAGTGSFNASDPNYIKLPLTIGDIQIKTLYYTYLTQYNGVYHLGVEGGWSAGILRGLVDIVYEPVN